MFATSRELGTNLICGKTRILTRPIFSSGSLKKQIGLRLKHCIGVTDVVTPIFFLFFQIAVKPFFRHLSLHCHINRKCLSNN